MDGPHVGSLRDNFGDGRSATVDIAPSYIRCQYKTKGIGEGEWAGSVEMLQVLEELEKMK